MVRGTYGIYKGEVHRIGFVAGGKFLCIQILKVKLMIHILIDTI